MLFAVRRGTALLWPWQPGAERIERGDKLVVVRATRDGAAPGAKPT